MKKMVLIVIMIFVLVACQDEAANEVRVGEINDVNVLVHTPFEEANLPSEITVILDGDMRTVPVTWTYTEFDEVKRYIVNGSIDQAAVDFDLPSGLSIHINVYVTAMTVLETIQFNPDLSIFNELIMRTGLDEILELEGPFTVFVPENDAFLAWFELFDTDIDGVLAQDDIESLLLYHVISGNYTRNVLVATVPGEIMTLGNDHVQVTLSGSRIELNGIASILSTEDAENGYVHVIDEILVSETQLENIFEDLFDEDLFAFLFEVFQEGDIPIDLLLEGNVTIFLPNETAWEAFLADEENDLESFLTSEAFVELLSYHIFAGRYTAESLYNDAPINIRNIRGDLVRVDVIEGDLTIQSALLESTEMFGDIAIIHIINQVLIPEPTE